MRKQKERITFLPGSRSQTPGGAPRGRARLESQGLEKTLHGLVVSHV